jgi:F0F1-type ATP synthase assembly protein I
MGTIKQEFALAFRSLSTASTIALSVVFSTFAGVLAGWWLDTSFFEGKTYPWLTILCFAFGLAGGVKNFMILTRRFTREAEKNGRRGQDNSGEEPRGKEAGHAQDDPTGRH